MKHNAKGIGFRRHGYCVLALLVNSALVVSGAVIDIGVPGDGGSSAPFGEGRFTLYQQLYDAFSLSSTPLSIERISFFHSAFNSILDFNGNPIDTVSPDTYVLQFFTVSTPVITLST